MGGGHYDVDVARETRTHNPDAFARNAYIAPATATAAARRQVHPSLDPFGKMRECNNETPIVVAMDVTRSRGDDTKIIYEKLPTFLGQIDLRGYVDGPGISFAAIGDATAGDGAPLQVSQFEADNRIDEGLGRIWIEEGGGGTGQESYELAAYFYARRTALTAVQQGKKGFFFFLGDEGFYPTIDPAAARRLLGDAVLDEAGKPTTLADLQQRRPTADPEQLRQIVAHKIEAPIDSKAIFAELQRKFHTFLIFPRKTMEERRKDIDAEIRKRVEGAGGLIDGVDIRASLLWNNRNDLDLHVVTPAGEHIYFGSKKGTCGGWLDVDMNVGGETDKPVENIRWRKGTAPAGRYRVYVQNYRFHERNQAPTPFKAELEINGKIEHIEGVISKRGETGTTSDLPIFEFTYDPSQRDQPAEKKAGTAYDAYADEVILKQWGGVLPPAHILRIQDPQSILDVMLGVLAITSGRTDLDAYLRDLGSRGHSDQRRQDVAQALGDLSRAWQAEQAQVSGALPTASEPRRGERAQRL